MVDGWQRLYVEMDYGGRGDLWWWKWFIVVEVYMLGVELYIYKEFRS
jgi:hypothetical protein